MSEEVMKLNPMVGRQGLTAAVAPLDASSSTGRNEGEYRKKLKSLDRRAGFNALEALAIELKSSNALLRILAGYPPTVKYYSDEEIQNNLPGHRLLPEVTSRKESND